MLAFDDDYDESDDDENCDENSSRFALPALPLGRGLAAPLLPRRARTGEGEEQMKVKSVNCSGLRLPPGARALRRALLHTAQARAEGGEDGEALRDASGNWSNSTSSCSSPEVWRAALEAVVASGGPVA